MKHPTVNWWSQPYGHRNVGVSLGHHPFYGWYVSFDLWSRYLRIVLSSPNYNLDRER